MIRLPLVVATLLLVLAAPASAREAVVRSFDGAELHVSFHPAKAGKRAPTILMTHGWGGKREQDPEGASSGANAGVGALRKAGFNVLTWDSRGFGESGGTVTIDYRANEGRDVKVLLNWLARQPEAKLDGKRDPRVGMHGGSYAGGIQFVAAAIDRRIDAIAPSIAWHSLLTSLYRAETIKGGWSSLLYAGGQSGRLDSHITSAFASGAVGGTLSAEDRAWFASRGPGSPGQAHQGADADPPGHARHALHAVGGDRQLPDPAPSGRAAEDAVVLRRPRDLLDRRGHRRAPREARGRVAAALRGAQEEGPHRAGLRVAGRRRQVAQRPLVPAAARHADRGRGLRHAAGEPGRHAVRHADRGRPRRPTP